MVKTDHQLVAFMGLSFLKSLLFRGAGNLENNFKCPFPVLKPSPLHFDSATSTKGHFATSFFYDLALSLLSCFQPKIYFMWSVFGKNFLGQTPYWPQLLQTKFWVSCFLVEIFVCHTPFKSSTSCFLGLRLITSLRIKSIFIKRFL